jgi:DNA helicase-2/ATP-dependent DNA helicase PcrA
MSTDIFAQLNDAQRKAVDTIDGPVMVIAGPGTGKTQLLALRAANILDKTDTAPQNILCLTYTEVGARNMRDRLTKFIGASAYDVPISTYHSFGSEIMRRYGEYFTEFGADQAVDTIGQDVIMHEIYEELPATNILWRKEVYLKDALGFISEAKRALLTPDDLRTIADTNDAFIKKGSTVVSECLHSLLRMDKKVLPLFEELFITLQKQLVKIKLPSDISPLDSLAVTELAEALVGAQETGKTNTLTVWKNNWLAKNSENEWILAGEKESKKLRSGADIYELYLQKLAAKNLFDYDDMILRAIEAIEKHDELRFTLQERYQYIMLDEFQDTNLAQLKIIELLTNNPTSEGRPNVLAVGDDDQAIFSFQGADLTNMLRFHSMYKDVSTITLTENWRSHADILHVAKNVSEQIEERLHERLGFTEKVLIAKNTKLPAKATIARHEFKSDIAQFAWIADEIATQIKNGENPNEIAVIAPRHKYLEPLVPYLEQLHIPVRYDKRENVLDDPHVNALLAMAELIVALAKSNGAGANSLWPAVLSADEWQLPTSTIWKLSWQSNKNYYENEESNWQAMMMEDTALRPIALFFAKLAAISKIETLETMLDYITGVTPVHLGEEDIADYTSPYYDYYFGKAKQQNDPIGFTQLLSNLTVLRQHLREYKKAQSEPLYLQDMLDFVLAYKNANEKLLNTSPYHSASNAVQLMTAYGAKGLEFATVYVVATLDDVWGMKARGQSSNITLPANLKLIRRAGTSKDERKRLFYVALTRAKHTLLLTSYEQNYAGKSTTHLEFLGESEDESEVISPLLPSHTQRVHKNDHADPELEIIERYWQTRHITGITQPLLRDLVIPRLETFQLSATHLNTFTDLVYGGPQAFFMNTILRFPKAPTADGQYGNAIHETLETMHNRLRAHGELPDIDESIQIFEQKLKAKRLSNNDFNRQLGRGKLALETFMPAWWPHFDPANEAEKSFRDEGVFIGDAHLSGNLDQLMIDHDNELIQVVDFKTGKPHSRWTRDVKMHKYRQQLLFYKLLVENSHTYKNFTVEKGRLVFVEPTEDGQLAELTLSYEKEDIERTKKLIEAVWKRIAVLDFPDTSAFSADITGILAFEDWLIEHN